MNNYKYTLIIPHYNDTFRLQRLLKSIPDRSDVQVIVVDDCSPDQPTLESVKNEFPSSQFISAPNNKGAGAARNIGLENAQGKFILFADSDDELLPGAFDVFDKTIKAENDITYFLAEAWQEESDKPSVRADNLNELCNNYHNEPNEQNLLDLKLGHCVPWAKVYSAEFIKKTGIKFDETPVSNDVYFNTINAVLAEKIAVQTTPVYMVYRLADSLTSTTTADRLIQRVKVSAKTANKLFELDIKAKRSASGYILQSISYGVSTFFKVFWIAINSKLKLNLLRIVEPSRWLAFFDRAKKLNSEKNHSNSKASK